MITRMKKYTFLVYHKEYEQFLLRLREAGVVHVTEKAEGVADNPQLNEQMAQAASLNKTIAAVEAYLPEGATLLEASQTAYDEALQAEFNALVAEKTQLEQAIQVTEKEAARMQVWGDFSSAKLQALQEAGYQLQYFVCSAGKYDAEWETLYNAFPVAEKSGNIYFVTVNHTNEAFALDAEEVELNAHSAAQLEQDITNLNGLLVAKQAQLEAWAIAHLATLQAWASQLQRDIDWHRVELSTDNLAEDRLKLLEGFCPADNAEALNQMLDADHIYYTEGDPQIEDNTPIELKNGFFAKLFEPITRLYSLPNYHELDPTPFFAPFFMLFFGLCMGDAGYGLLIVAVAALLLAKFPSMRNWGWLALFCGLSTMVVGFITGMFFGIDLSTVALFAPIKDYFVTDANFKELCGGYSPMMVFAICIGIFQILFAMGYKVVNITIHRGFKYAVYDLSWLLLLITAIVWLIASPTGVALYVVYGILGLCAAGVLFYSDPDKKYIVLNVGGGLWGTYNMISGLLGDVLSYIRLFALGLAGGILGSVFNSLAMQVGGAMPAWIGWLPMIFVMVFGHALNFFLTIISSVVHPLRLTFVEFYKNAGVEGGGTEYKPFKK